MAGDNQVWEIAFWTDGNKSSGFAIKMFIANCKRRDPKNKTRGWLCQNESWRWVRSIKVSRKYSRWFPKSKNFWNTCAKKPNKSITKVALQIRKPEILNRILHNQDRKCSDMQSIWITNNSPESIWILMSLKSSVKLSKTIFWKRSILFRKQSTSVKRAAILRSSLPSLNLTVRRSGK